MSKSTNKKIINQRPEKKERRESAGEKECRRVFEKLTGEEFPRLKPEWLINPRTGRRLELDGYSRKLKLAFEFDGKHHYADNDYYGTKLAEVRYRDGIKDERCRQRGVKLIRISYTITDIEDYLTMFLKEYIKPSDLKTEILTRYEELGSLVNKLCTQIDEQKSVTDDKKSQIDELNKRKPKTVRSIKIMPVDCCKDEDIPKSKIIGLEYNGISIMDPIKYISSRIKRELKDETKSITFRAYRRSTCSYDLILLVEFENYQLIDDSTLFKIRHVCPKVSIKNIDGEWFVNKLVCTFESVIPPEIKNNPEYVTLDFENQVLNHFIIGCEYEFYDGKIYKTINAYLESLTSESENEIPIA